MARVFKLMRNGCVGPDASKGDVFLAHSRIEVLEEEEAEKFLDRLRVFDPHEKIPLPGGTKRTPMKHAEPAERKWDFREGDKGFSPQEAVAEATRCLRCYRVVTYAYRTGSIPDTIS